MVTFFQTWGEYKAIKFNIYSNLGYIEKVLSISALIISVKLLGLISTFAPIIMFDLN
jgi:hypothetical protein